MFISDYIQLNVANILKEENILEDEFRIVHSEDCFSIIFTRRSEIFSDMVEEVRKCFDNQFISIRVNEDSFLVLDVHIFEGCPALYKEVSKYG